MNMTKVEFAVQMRSDKCMEIVRDILKDEGEVQIDRQLGSVIVQTQQPWSVLQDKIQSTGRKAVLSGFGGQSAVAVINANGSVVDRSAIQGVVRFCSITNQQAGVVIDGTVDGLTPGLHGMHIHESGDTSAGCKSVGEHYNPHGSPHGGPSSDSSQRHAGDLGNIRADESGRATFRMIDPVLEVWNIVGRSIVITENEDDLGCGGTKRSHIDGNSGNRIACGIIARSAGIMQNFKKICACDGLTLWDERKEVLNGKNVAEKR